MDPKMKLTTPYKFNNNFLKYFLYGRRCKPTLERLGKFEKDSVLRCLPRVTSLTPVNPADMTIVSRGESSPNSELCHRGHTGHMGFYNIMCPWKWGHKVDSQNKTNRHTWTIEPFYMNMFKINSMYLTAQLLQPFYRSNELIYGKSQLMK